MITRSDIKEIWPSQAKFAVELGVTTETVSRWIHRKSPVPVWVENYVKMRKTIIALQRYIEDNQQLALLEKSLTHQRSVLSGESELLPPTKS